MNTAEPNRFLCSSPAERDKEALTNSRLDRLATLAVQHVRTPGFGNRFNALAAPKQREGGSTLLPRRSQAEAGQRFNVLIFLAALLLFPFIAIAQTISPANLPLYFEANNDQTEFLSSGNGYQFTISASGVQMSLRESQRHAATAQMRFAGANAEAQIHGGGEMPGKINYLIGNDASKWQTGLPTFGNVQVTELYPGINLVFHGNQRQLEYDFSIAPGANPNAIKMQFQGVDQISITPDGELILKIGTGEVHQPQPKIFQTVSGEHKTIAGGYRILDSRTVAFEVSEYDHTLPLVIDPVLGYSTFFGGNVGDTAWAMALDTNQCIYIAGETFSTHFSTVGAAQTNFAGGQYNGDAFVAKLDQTGTNLIYLTYLGGSGDDVAASLAVDSLGNAFVGGGTDSKNFPTNNALYPTIPTVYSSYYGLQPESGFMAELNTNGTQLIYSTYLGGKSANLVEAIAIDSADNAYAVGYTFSTDFPVTTNALERFYAGTNGTTFLNPNGFLTEIASNGSSLVYSTYLGGTNYDVATDVAVDPNSDVYVCGYTASFNFPTWNTPANLPYGRFLNGVTNKTSTLFTFDGFVTKFPPLSGTILPASQTNFYSTFLGGTNNDEANGITADASGNAYVTGLTSSTNFPVINPPPGLPSYLTTNGYSTPVATNVFLTKIAANGSAVDNSVVFGGNLVDVGYKVAVDTNGDAFVVGTETSITNFPTTNTFGSLLSTNSFGGGVHDAFVTGISANWSNVFYSVCIGGNLDTYGYGIALDSSTNVFITGSTASTNYPTLNASKFWFNGTNFINGTNSINGARFTGTNDAFLTEIMFASTAPIVSIEPTNLIVGYGATVTFNATIAGATGQLLYQWQTNGTNLVNGGRISGVNSSTLTITNGQPGDSSTNYGLIASNPSGTGAESNITLTVLDMPYIIAPPTNQFVVPGANMSFSVVASGSPLFYLWSTNGLNSAFITNNSHYSGATNSTLTITNVQASDAGVYTVYVYNNISPYTNVSAVLAEPLSITADPTNQTVGADSTVSFTVVAAGAPLFYQWQTNGVNLTNGVNINGATSSTLTLTNVQTHEGGTYTVIVDNGIQTNNASAMLTVTPIEGAVFTGFSPAAGGIGNGLVLSGTGGPTNGTYSVLTSSNLLVPVSQWMPIATNQFNSQGQFIFTNPVSTNTSQFFILKEP